MEEKLTSQDIIKLISLYRSHPLLWDVTDEDYKRPYRRSKAYAAIAKEMGMTVEFVKRNMISLRATYSCEMRKMALKKESLGTAANYISTIPWLNEMGFLDNFIKTKHNAIPEKEIDITVLKKHVDIIRLSKVIPRKLCLEQLTGTGVQTIYKVLQNQDNIFKKWVQHLNKNILSSTISDDCADIDVVLLEWVERCKMYGVKIPMAAIKREAMKLAKLLKITSYFIKPQIWIEIGKILHNKSNEIKSIDEYISIKRYKLLNLLKKDGRYLLTQETHRRFLKTIRNSIASEKHLKANSLENNSTNGADKSDLVGTEENNENKVKMNRKASHSDNETIATSTSIEMKTVNTDSADEFTTIADPIREKEKSLEYENDESNFNILEQTAAIKEEIDDDGETVDDFCEEFIDISDDTAEASSSKINNSPPVVYQQIKEEPEILMDEEAIVIDEEDDCDETQEVNRYSPSIDEERKQTIDEETEVFQNVEIAGGENETEKRLQDFDENLPVSNKKIKTEPNELCDKENQIENKTPDNLTNISESEISAAKNPAGDVEEEDMPVVFEIEDCDDELIEIINNYTKTTAERSEQENQLIKKTEIKEEKQSDDDVFTVIEITSDDDCDSENNDDDDDSNSGPLINLKRSLNEMQDNLPSTSQSAFPFSLPTSSPVTKEEDLKLTIKSKVEAFKYLHCIKKFFQSQNDEEACKIITRLMVTFMLCSDINEKET